MKYDIDKIKDFAIGVALEAGKFILKNMKKALKIDYKGRVNMVTEVDKDSQDIIISRISKEFPNAGIIAEESDTKTVNKNITWIIDPLDGTTNFVHGFQCFAVSIAAEIDSKIILGVVYDPVRKEMFYATNGAGAYLNGKKIHVSRISRLIDSLLVTGFPYELNQYFYKNMELFKALYEKCQGVRRTGAATIDLCYLACGRFDGYWEFNLNPWDVAAGSIIVKEAGGKISDMKGGDFSIYGKEYLATNGLIHDEMLEVIRKYI
ncbi:MAG: inositol monophosphatase [Candidatus Marinimicrobia bacterium]|nr:inositol monophosphatase [Candidatus Neomarinimicrobiota bacterium]